jgi:ubiquinone/menaquinone biosynthesis C-methylase UbiE
MFNSTWWEIARRVLPAGVRRIARLWLSRGTCPTWDGRTSSSGCQILHEEPGPELENGWRDWHMAERQLEAFIPLLEQMRAGEAREDFVALAEAVRLTQAESPLIIEVGCGSGWNSEVLRWLLKRPFQYVGLDYSVAMTTLARQEYPKMPVVVGDATRLPFHDRSCDILLSGTVLMHVLGYQQAIRESRRVPKRWCIFHTIPVVVSRPTTYLRKYAYGTQVVEVVFNQNEFESLLANYGFAIRHVLKSIPHHYLEEVIREQVTAKTYLCEVD